jgi:hypothetical protein
MREWIVKVYPILPPRGVAQQPDFPVIYAENESNPVKFLRCFGRGLFPRFARAPSLRTPDYATCFELDALGYIPSESLRVP